MEYLVQCKDAENQIAITTFFQISSMVINGN